MASVAVDNNAVSVKEGEEEQTDEDCKTGDSSSPPRIANRRGSITGTKKGAVLNRPRISLLLEEYTA
eukprot:scaffold132504_cov25-Prasinocladus_malaysianus.AAC.1